MEALVINSDDSGLSMDMENAAIRIAYILGFTVKSVSTLWSHIFFEEFFGSYSIKDKMRTLIDMDKDEENKRKGQEVFDNYTTFNKVKHKPPQLLISLKKVEINVQNTFQVWMDAVLNDEYEKTFINLNKIVEPNAFEVLKVFHDDEEHEDKDYVSLSKAFLKLLPGFEATTNVFFLPPEFFNEHNSKKLNFFSSDDDEAKNPLNTYLDICFTFYDLKDFTPAELQITRNQLATSAASFIKNFEEWTGMFQPSRSDIERLDFFKEKIKAEAKIYNTVAEDSKMLNHYPLSGNEGIFHVLIGEMPVADIYEFYKHWKVIGEEGWSKIQAATSKEGNNKRWPVMALRTDKQATGTIDNKDEVSTLINYRKKSIIID